MELNHCENPTCLDIFVKRILARHVQNDEQILFDEKINPATQTVTKVPLPICINNTNPYDQPISCVDPKFMLCCTEQKIICKHKSRIIIDYKLLLLVKYCKCNFECITLPDAAFPTAAVPTPRVVIDNISVTPTPKFPITVAKVGNQILQIIYSQKEGYMFRFIKDVPLTDFDEPIPNYVFDDPTLQSHILLKNIRTDVDVVGDTPDGLATEVLISVFADIIDKLGVDQDIWVEGNPEEDC